MASIPQEVKLHILFAWRGDAFVLDYTLNNVRRLLLVDGGPQIYKIMDYKVTPFFRYYLAALRNIWGNAGATIPLDIEVSHLDDDHYAGIYSLLTSTQLGNAINWVDVKLLLPYLNTKDIYDKFLAACGARGLGYERLSQANQNRLAGFTMHYPEAQQILQFRNSIPGNLGPGQPLKFTGNSVFTATNQSSIILQNNINTTNPTTDRNGAALFTGDSSVAKISPYIGQGVPKLAVYKIQHHGARLDSFAEPNGNDDFQTANDLMQECVILMMLNFTEDQLSPKMSPDDNGMTMAYDVIPQQNQITLDLAPLNILAEADTWLRQNWKPYLTTQPAPLQNMSYKPWFQHLFKGCSALALFRAYNIGQCYQFYKTFKADSYVVSGCDEVHGHPRPEVLCGLALACLHLGYTATLFVTDATVFWKPNFEECAKDPNMIHRGHINDYTFYKDNNFYFAENHLKVYYLDQRMYMTIDVRATVTMGDSWERLDPTSANFAKPLTFDDASKVRATNFTLHMKENTTLSGRDNLYIKCYRIKAHRRVRDPNTNLTATREAGALLAYPGAPHQILDNATLANMQDIPCYFLWETPCLAGSWKRIRLALMNARSATSRDNPVVMVAEPDFTALNSPFWTLSTLEDDKAADTFVFDPNNPIQTPDLATKYSVSNTVVFTAMNRVLYEFVEVAPPQVTMAMVAQPQFTLNWTPAVAIPIDDEETDSMTLDDDTEDAVQTLAVAAADESAAAEEVHEGEDLVDQASAVQTPPETEEATRNDDSMAATLVDPPQAVDILTVLEGAEAADHHDAASKADVLAADRSVDLRTYLMANHFEPEKITPRRIAIDALIGKDRDVTKNLKLGYDQLLLETPVDLDHSMVEAGTNAGDEIVSASLETQTEPSSEISFGQDKYLIRKTTMLLIRAKDQKLSIGLSIETESDMTIAVSKLVALAAKKPTLRQYLGKQGLQPEEFDKLKLSDILQLLLGDDPDAKIRSQIWVATPTIFQDAGLLGLVPMLDESVVELFPSPIGTRGAVRDASLKATMDSSIFPSSFEFAGLKPEVEQVFILMKDMAYPTQAITLAGSVTIASGTDGLRLSMTCQLSSQPPVMSFEVSSLSKYKSLTQLGAVLGAFRFDDVKNLNVPVLKPENNKPISLDSLPDGSSVGFTIRERLSKTDRFELSSVFISIDSKDWLDYLPSTFNSSGVNAKTKITVLRPTQPNRAVRAQVDFEFKVDATRKLDVGFLADPLDYPGDYDYRLSINCVGGITLDEITKALGFSLLESDMISAVPLVANIISKVGVERFVAAVDNVTRSVHEWSIDVVLKEPLELIPGMFTLYNAKVNVQQLGKDTVTSDGSGELCIDGLNKFVTVAYSTPQPAIPGKISAKVPDGVSVVDVANALKMPDMSDLPVIGTFVRANLESFETVFGYEPTPSGDGSSQKDDKRLSIFGASVRFFWKDSIDPGPLVLTHVSVSAAYQTKNYPGALGIAGHQFQITAHVFDNSTEAEVGYEAKGDNSVLYATLRPLRAIKLATMIDKVLPSELKADLTLSVQEIALNQAVMGVYFEKKDNKTAYGLDRFDVQLGTVSKLDVQGSRQKTDGFQLIDLMVSYRRGKAKGPSEPPKANPSTQSPSGSALPPSTGSQDLDDTSALVLDDKDKKKIRSRVFSRYIRSIATATGDGMITTWNTDEVYPELNTLVVTGTASINASTIALSIAELDKHALQITNILSLFGFAEKPEYDNPDSSINFWDLEIVRLGGSVEIVSSTENQRKVKLSTAEMVVKTGEHRWEIMDQPNVAVEKLGLEVTYDARRAVETNSGLEATFYAKIMIAGHPLAIICRKDAKYGFVFLGCMTFNEKANLQLTDLTSQFLDPAANFKLPNETQGVKLPNSIRMGRVSLVFQRNRLVQIEALGLDLWSFDIAETGLKFKIEKLGAFIKAEKKSPDDGLNGPNPQAGAPPSDAAGKSQPSQAENPNGKYEYTVQLAGQFSIENYGSFLEANALLNITPKDDKVLTVTLVTKSGDKADIATLASRLTTDTGSEWAKTLVNKAGPGL
ncbi:hypothetical protein OPT61_g6955 [Boeremia exigua]|uniref:Uncharacterized protein n=1 Tax=Boeremia exigua TaxID=749465 RepID=A0ACC2I5R8_9PLEO|nr:hypothetical protein OPT61_g6955 [Boeremia exigua]